MSCVFEAFMSSVAITVKINFNHNFLIKSILIVPINSDSHSFDEPTSFKFSANRSPNLSESINTLWLCTGSTYVHTYVHAQFRCGSKGYNKFLFSGRKRWLILSEDQRI